MVFIPEQLIDRLIQEDVPYFDLTTHALNFGEKPAEIRYATRHQTRLACVEEAATMLTKVGAEITLKVDSGQTLETGTPLLIATGKSGALHAVWKASQNLLEYACGVATKTHRLVQLARKVNPQVMLYTTRKSIPGTKAIAVRAILAGSAYPHRLGLSESILIFEQHLNFIGGLEGLIQKLPILKPQMLEKKIVVEVSEAEDAIALAEAGIDEIQFDKVSAADLSQIIPKLKSIHPGMSLLAAGGIDEANIAEYAATGVNGIVSTSPYYAKPANIDVKILPI